MGGLWSIISSFMSGGLNICHTVTVNSSNCFCCTDNIEPSHTEKKDMELMAPNFMLLDDYFLAKHPVTQQYYIKENVAYFTTDANGVATSSSDNMEEFIGLSKEENLQSIAWVANVASNSYEIFSEWKNKAKSRQPCILKIHFRYTPKGTRKKVDRFTVVESRPMFDKEDGSYLGLKGIVLNLPQNIWSIFNERDFSGSDSSNSHNEILCSDSDDKLSDEANITNEKNEVNEKVEDVIDKFSYKNHLISQICEQEYGPHRTSSRSNSKTNIGKSQKINSPKNRLKKNNSPNTSPYHSPHTSPYRSPHHSPRHKTLKHKSINRSIHTSPIQNTSAYASSIKGQYKSTSKSPPKTIIKKIVYNNPYLNDSGSHLLA